MPLNTMVAFGVFILMATIVMLYSMYKFSVNELRQRAQERALDERRRLAAEGKPRTIDDPQSSGLKIPMEFSIAAVGFKCPICSAEVVKDAEVVRCSRCQTPAHQDCFEFNDHKCGVFACGNKTYNKFESSPAPCQCYTVAANNRPFQCKLCNKWQLDY